MRKTSNSFSDEVALFHEGEYLEKLREFRALVLRRIRAHIDDEDEKEEEEEEEEEEERTRMTDTYTHTRYIILIQRKKTTRPKSMLFFYEDDHPLGNAFDCCAFGSV